jgi:UTP--glucose-1-phosphate uridylyltransferase
LFASAGSFLLTPDILPILEQEKTGVGGELVLADAITELVKEKPVYCRFIEGVWHDAGDKGRYLQAIVDYALLDPELGPTFREYLKSRICNDK